jgi:hypothetical protein
VSLWHGRGAFAKYHLELRSYFVELLRPEFVELTLGWIILVASFLIFDFEG